MLNSVVSLDHLTIDGFIQQEVDYERKGTNY